MKNKMNRKGQAMLGNFAVLIIFVVALFVGGILAGLVYYDMNILNSTLQTINFPIPIENNMTNAYNITDFQGILGATIYPLLGLSSSLPYLSYFMVFAFIIAMAMTAYVSSKNAVFFVLHLLFTFVIAYFCIILSNTYITLLSNPFINSIMVNFSVYNKLMEYLPAVVLFTSLLFAAIAFVNLMKPQSNMSGNQGALNYGGDY